jgi:phosphate transport system permease protein
MEAASTPANHPLLQGPPNLKRRHRVNRALEIVAWVSAVVAVGALFIVIASVFVKGAGALNLDFLTQGQVAFGPGGGIGNAIVGTAIIVALGAAMAIPVGVLVALYTSEFATGRSASAVRYVLDILNGVPTIITGLFVFALIVKPQGHQSGFAGAVGLAIVMLPLVARSTQEVLALVPASVKEAGLALGISRWRTIVSVIIPTAFGGILTAALVAVARAAGETAPLLIVCSIFPTTTVTDPSQALPNIPIVIFQYSESPDPSKHTQAWAAALVLILFVLLLSSVARVFAARTKKRLEGAR